MTRPSEEPPGRAPTLFVLLSVSTLVASGGKERDSLSSDADTDTDAGSDTDSDAGADADADTNCAASTSSPRT